MDYPGINGLIRRYRPQAGTTAISYSAAQGTLHAVHHAMQMQQQMQQQMHPHMQQHTYPYMYPHMQQHYTSTGYYNPIVISADGLYISTIPHGALYNL
ncbi:TPA: DUF3947 family protein [Bacillus cereus]|uniref:DUF3947 family protein n=1 Tax=Bacillus cereus group TaxID=86661 RepID=UPI000789C205|nr:DUF3947 family protein [Bacillus cereus]SMD64128.1 hypothetical protein BACERE00184_00444 [Bacillus cereus]HDR8087994.1 DUF3947 family protein [Bacillus cereus]HDX9522779.1 DUF3947 family protein [Bacillus cereus]HDX9585263.1 DUF3947 family protein [Bacillus cereus]HDX9607472.1 DUF3947 family protein [Bacillus cereus]